MPDFNKNKNAVDYDKALAQSQQKIDFLKDNFWNNVEKNTIDPYSSARPYSYNAESTSDPNKNFERFYSHSSYSKLGYNPWADNDEIYNAQGSASGDVWRATKTAGKLAWTGFMSPLRSYADIAAGKPFAPDYDSAEEMKYLNTVGSSSRGGVTGFTSNLITNSGYTLGLLGEMALEYGALAAVTVETGGLGTAGLITARAGKYAKDWGKISTAIEGINDTVNSINNYGKAKSVWEAVKSTGKFINPLENTTGLFGSAKAIEDYKALDNLAKVSKTAGAFYRDLQAANLTLAEAKMEGASTEKDLEEILIGEYKAQNGGKDPDVTELLNIKQTAKDAGMKTLGWNMPAIYLTNKITFAPLFKPVSKYLGPTVSEGSRFIEQEGKGIVKATFANTFTASLKPKNFLKNTVNYFAGNLSEGIQETTQEIISGTAKDYYHALYNNPSKKGLDYAQGENQSFGVWDALSKNVTDQFSGQGFETFASGFFMGGLIGGAGHIVKAPFKVYKDYQSEKKAYEVETQKTLNELYQDPLKYYGNGILNYANGTEALAGQANAEMTGNKKEWIDFENQNLTGHVVTALETGTYDIFLQKLNGVRSMDPKAIKDAYGIDGAEVLSKIDKIIDRADRIKDNYDKWTERYENPYNPRLFKQGTPEYNQEAIAYKSWEAAKRLAVFNESSFARNVDRIQSMTNDLIAQESFKTLDGNDLMMLLSPRSISSELKLLQNEIEVGEYNAIASEKGLLRTKKNKLKYLNRLNETMKGFYIGQHLDGLTEEQKNDPEYLSEKLKNADIKSKTKSDLFNAYKDYLTHLTDISGNPVPINDLAIQQSFQNLLDIHDLNQDNLIHADAVNMLANPKNFIAQHQNLNKVFSDLYEAREEMINNAIKESQAKIEDNTILTALFNRGFAVSPKDAEKLLKNKEIPDEFYDVNAKQVVDKRDPIRYQEFVNIVSTYVEATKTEQKTKEDLKTDDTTKDDLKDETVVSKTVRDLNIDLDKLFGAVKTLSQLESLDRELDILMSSTTLEEREKAKLYSEDIVERKLIKEDEIASMVSMDTLMVGDVVRLKNSDYENAIVVKKLKDSVVVSPVGVRSIKITIMEDKLKDGISGKYSEKTSGERVSATDQEKTKVKENATKQEKLLDNRDLVNEIVTEAEKNPEEARKNFIDTLGCK